MDYKYYLFRDENYGDIYTDYYSFYNKKLRKENDEVLSKTFLKTLILCLALTVISVVFYAIFDVSLIMWLAFTFLGLAFVFELLFVLFLVRVNRATYIADFKLTKEYLDQVAVYKAVKGKEYTEKLFKVIDKYNELKKAQIKEETKEEPKEVVVKLDDELVEKIAKKIQEVLENSNTKAIEDCVKVMQQTTTEVIKEETLEEVKPQVEELEIKEEPKKEKSVKRTNRRKAGKK